MAFADLRPTRVHYELAGDPSLPVIVLSHSLGVSLEMWRPQIAALESNFRVLSYDIRGHGKSSIPPIPYSVEDLGADVIGLLDSLELEQVSFCGLSMGGAIGQWLGVNAPNRLTKLILANTAAKFGVADNWNARIETVMQSGLETVVPGTLERWFTPAFRMAQPDVIAATAAILYATDVQGYAACCAAVRDTDFRDTIHKVSVPTLIISGTFDPVTPPSEGLFLAREITNAKYVQLEAAHLSSVEATGAFNQALLSFLADEQQ